MEIIDIQKALAKRGFDPGPADGVWGRRTIAAVKAFQESKGLKADGVVGPETAAALMDGAREAGAQSQAAPLVWYEEARRQLGTKEKPGPASNPRFYSGRASSAFATAAMISPGAACSSRIASARLCPTSRCRTIRSAPAIG